MLQHKFIKGEKWDQNVRLVKKHMLAVSENMLRWAAQTIQSSSSEKRES